MGFSAALTKMHRSVTHLARTGGIGGEMINGVESYAYGRGLGYLHGKYRDQTSIKGVPMELYGGIAAKALSIAATLMSHGRGAGGFLGDRLSTAGTVALGAYGYLHGVEDGTKASGRKVFILEAGAAAPKEMGGLKQTDMLGAIDPAVGGAVLSTEGLIDFVRQR